MRRFLFAGALFLVLALLTGCGGEKSSAPTGPEMARPEILGAVYVNNDDVNSHCVGLYADQTIEAGQVCVTVEDDQLCVTYTTTEGWKLTEAHLWVGETLAEMPQTRKGNPKVGNFPHASGDITGQMTYTFCIPVADLGGEPHVCGLTFHISAHAALRFDNGDGTYDEMTGWGDGVRMVERGNWATYFSINLTCGPDEPPLPENCEDAFARCYEGLTCFLAVDEDGDGVSDFDQWGWSNGPLTPNPWVGAYYTDIWIGAKDCDPGLGTPIGTATIEYWTDPTYGPLARVSYNVTNPDYTLEETHLYIGSEVLPRDEFGQYTIAYDAYTEIHSTPASPHTDTFFIDEGLTGEPIYVIAHAIVCIPDSE